MTLSSLVPALLVALSASLAQAEVTVTDPWVRGTVPGQQASGAFMTLVSSTGGKLLAVSSPVASQAEVHEMAMADGVMKMRQIPHLDLPANKPVELKSGGYHIMLMGLKAPLTADTRVPLTLTVEEAGQRKTVEVSAPVRALGAAPRGHGGHKH